MHGPFQTPTAIKCPMVIRDQNDLHPAWDVRMGRINNCVSMGELIMRIDCG